MKQAAKGFFITMVTSAMIVTSMAPLGWSESVLDAPVENTAQPEIALNAAPVFEQRTNETIKKAADPTAVFFDAIVLKSSNLSDYPKDTPLSDTPSLPPSEPELLTSGGYMPPWLPVQDEPAVSGPPRWVEYVNRNKNVITITTTVDSAVEGRNTTTDTQINEQYAWEPFDDGHWGWKLFYKYGSKSKVTTYNEVQNDGSITTGTTKKQWVLSSQIDANGGSNNSMNEMLALESVNLTTKSAAGDLIREEKWSQPWDQMRLRAGYLLIVTEEPLTPPWMTLNTTVKKHTWLGDGLEQDSTEVKTGYIFPAVDGVLKAERRERRIEEVISTLDGVEYQRIKTDIDKAYEIKPEGDLLTVFTLEIVLVDRGKTTKQTRLYRLLPTEGQEFYSGTDVDENGGIVEKSFWLFLRNGMPRRMTDENGEWDGVWDAEAQDRLMKLRNWWILVLIGNA